MDHLVTAVKQQDPKLFHVEVTKQRDKNIRCILATGDLDPVGSGSSLRLSSLVPSSSSSNMMVIAFASPIPLKSREVPDGLPAEFVQVVVHG
jgi:hypothetical protein